MTADRVTIKSGPPPVPRRAESSRGRDWLIAGGMVAVLVGAIAWLATRPAALEAFLPHCPLHRATGLLCPGCGGTRAVDAIFHGDSVRALHCNPITTIALPLLVVMWLRWVYKVATRRPGSTWSIHVPHRLVYAIAAALTLFMILRNIPHPAFDLLRPPK